MSEVESVNVLVDTEIEPLRGNPLAIAIRMLTIEVNRLNSQTREARNRVENPQTRTDLDPWIQVVMSALGRLRALFDETHNELIQPLDSEPEVEVMNSKVIDDAIAEIDNELNIIKTVRDTEKARKMAENKAIDPIPPLELDRLGIRAGALVSAKSALIEVEAVLTARSGQSSEEKSYS